MFDGYMFVLVRMSKKRNTEIIFIRGARLTNLCKASIRWLNAVKQDLGTLNVRGNWRSK